MIDIVSKQTGLGALRGLLPFMKPYRRAFVVAMFALVVAAGATLMIPHALRYMIDFGFTKGNAAGSSHSNALFLENSTGASTFA